MGCLSRHRLRAGEGSMSLIPYAGYDPAEKNSKKAFIKPKHVLARREAGMSVAELARFYHISERTVRRWIQEQQEACRDRA